MAIYKYNGPLVDEVTFRRSQQQRGDIAYIHAKPDSDPAKLAGVTSMLKGAGWDVLPVNYNGKPCLEVRGHHKDKNLTGLLASAGAVIGQPTITATADDKTNPKEKLKNGTLQASGVSYVVGDLGFAMYGYKDSNFLNVLAGAFYFLGSNSLMWFGRRDNSQQELHDVSDKMHRFLHGQDIKLPPDAALKEFTKEKPKTFLQKVEGVLARYPAEIMNVMFAGAGLCIMLAVRSELKQLKLDKVELPKVLETLQKGSKEAEYLSYRIKHIPKEITAKYMDIGLGSMTIASGLASAFVKEKAPDPTKPKRGGIGGVIDWVREKPLRIAGYGYIGSTLCHAVSTAIETQHAGHYIKTFGDMSKQPFEGSGFTKANLHKDMVGGVKSAVDRKDSLKWRSLFVGANLLAEFLMSVSSKGHGEGVKSEGRIDESMYSIMADTVSRQPEANRAQFIERLAGRLAARDALGGSAADHAEGIRTELAMLEQNPWRKKHDNQVPLPVVDAPEASQQQGQGKWTSAIMPKSLNPEAIAKSGAQPQLSM